MGDRPLDQELDALRGDLAALRADLAGVAKALEESGKRRAETVKTTLADLLGPLEEELRGALGTIADLGEESAKAVSRRVEHRPLLSLLAAFGAGFLLGKILDRRQP